MSEEDFGYPPNRDICRETFKTLGQDLAKIHNAKIAAKLMGKYIDELEHKVYKLSQGA